MSQDGEETTKYKVNNNHQQQHYHDHEKHYGQTRKIHPCHEQQVVGPLYENSLLTNNNNNNHKKRDHFIVEHCPSKSATFNNQNRFDSNTRYNADLNVQTDDCEYENIDFGNKDNFADKKLLLQKYFRSALVGPRTNIYENLCRGCNYGVFNARGPLCTFCECIVNGVGSVTSGSSENIIDRSNNIYENICESCGIIYSGSNSSEECKCRLREESEDLACSLGDHLSFNEGSEEFLIENKVTVKSKKKVKINKSKSFNKSNKPKIFTNFWETLRKPKSSSLRETKKPLEIIHHVEGYEQVFHTQDTFDLQKICELKRSVTSCSDQHIYGRLKLHDLSVSSEEFNSTQSLTQGSSNLSVASGKKPRISKAKFLRTQSPQNSDSLEISDLETKASKPNTTIYLNTSVCQWMTSLRHEIHAYNTFLLGNSYEIDQDSVCYPKSIPSKNVLISCKAPVTNQPQKLQKQNFKTLLQKHFEKDKDFLNLTEIHKEIFHNSMTSLNSENLEEGDKKLSINQKDCYQLMVEEFMANIINRQMLKTKDLASVSEGKQNAKAMAGVNNHDSYAYNSNNNNNYPDIPLRQANLTSSMTTNNNHNNNNSNRHKRQGMYLRLEDHEQLQQDHQAKREEQMNLHNHEYRNNQSYKNKDNCHKNVIHREEESVKRRLESNNNELEYDSGKENKTVSTPDPQTTNCNRDHDDFQPVSRDMNYNELRRVAADLQLNNLQNDHEDLKLVSRNLNSNILERDLRRAGIHERNVLEAFEALLEQERSQQLTPTEEDLRLDTKIEKEEKEQQNQESLKEIEKDLLPESALYIEIKEDHSHITSSSLQLQTFGDNSQTISQLFPNQILDIIQLINQQQLAASLNTIIICYDRYLLTFLHFIYQRKTNKNNSKSNAPPIVYEIPNKQLVRKFKQFYRYCEQNSKERPISQAKIEKRVLNKVSSNLKLDLKATKCKIVNNAQNCETKNESLTQPLNGLKRNNYMNDQKTKDLNKSLSEIKDLKQKVKTPPLVPKRDPKTKLSPTSELRKKFPFKMTVPANNLKTQTPEDQGQEEESIYQPIWKFETKGKVLERYQTDDDYYDLKSLKAKLQKESPHSELPKILISDDILEEEEEDDNNWEPDEEFVFTKDIKKQRSSSLTSDRNSTIRSIQSCNSSQSSLGTSSSLSGSTITEFASSTATLASTISSSLRHNLLRNIGIFYSLTEPKLRAIIYDYDRIHSSTYFAKTASQTININDSGIGKSLSPIQSYKLRHNFKSQSNSSSPLSSNHSSPISLTKREIKQKLNNNNNNINNNNSESVKAKVPCTIANSDNNTPAPPFAIPSSVQAWKYQLMDVNYMEDEEDMIVSECEILRAQEIKKDIEQLPPIQPRHIYKSRSTENILDLPIEDDKKTIAERLANMYTKFSPIQRGILNINNRNSPKSEKKAYKLNRSNQATSLYLEDGLKPKYPIFGAPLHQLELQQNVPRFIVDAVDYIERKDRIMQDGIYRACGNKFFIDELKQKLSKSYIYDSKLLVADDIHTVTSLLKQFFRDLPEPVIPQDIYDRITAGLADKQDYDPIRIAIEEMKEPNKSTLRFLIKHLTNVVACSSSNRMNASNVAIVWGPSLFDQNDSYNMIGRMNTLTKVLIENYDRIFDTNERLL